MKHINLLILVACLFSLQVKSQENTEPPRSIDKVSLGLGMGFDHGGFGANLMVYPKKYLGLFAGGGYALAGFGYNAGAKLRLVSEKPNVKVNGFIMAMYGYNTAIVVADQTELSKLFYGPTFAIGLETRKKPHKNGFWTIALTVPIRGTNVDDYMKDLEDNHGIEFQSELFPVGFSLGYRIVISEFL